MQVTLRLIVFLKYARNVLSCYADAAVPDLDTYLVPSTTTANQNRSLLSVAHRIRKQIPDHNFEHVSIAANVAAGSNHPPLQTLFLCEVAEIVCHRVKHDVELKVAH